jgi:hypothetical protein
MLNVPRNLFSSESQSVVFLNNDVLSNQITASEKFNPF